MDATSQIALKHVFFDSPLSSLKSQLYTVSQLYIPIIYPNHISQLYISLCPHHISIVHWIKWSAHYGQGSQGSGIMTFLPPPKRFRCLRMPENPGHIWTNHSNSPNFRQGHLGDSDPYSSSFQWHHNKIVIIHLDWIKYHLHCTYPHKIGCRNKHCCWWISPFSMIAPPFAQFDSDQKRTRG